MSNHHRSAIFQILLIACLFCSSSILHGQSTEIRPATYSPAPLPSIPTPSPYQKPSLRKFAFKNAKATDVFKIQCQLAGEENLHSVAVDERTNSIIYLADDPKAREIEEFYILLDAAPQAPVVAGSGVSISVPALGPKPLAFDFSFGFLRDGESVETLRSRYNELEQQAHQLAGKIKQSKSLSESERSELKAAVRKSFEARQALQRAELADLAQRMKNMQQSIDMRDKLAEKVIERRIEELLNPNLKWDTTNTSEQMPANGGIVKNESKVAPLQSDSKPQPSGRNNRSSLPSTVLPVNNGPIIQGIRQEVQGNWIVESISTASENGLTNVETPLILNITGDSLTYPTLNDQSLYLRWRGHSKKSDDGQSFDAVDLVVDRNGEDEAWCAGIISCDKDRLRICFTKGYYDKMSTEGIRPSGFLSGPNFSLIECRREPKAASKTNESNEVDLSTPQATLNYIHRYSLAHPGDFPFECYTDDALLELSGMMLQNLSMMSAMSQIALQTGGVIGEKDGVPVVSGMPPAFHIQVDALLKEHISTTPTESANRAYELLVKLTFGSKSSSAASLVHADRQLIRMAAGVLKSPKEFLPAASKLLTAFGENDADVTKAKETAQTQPKADIAINGDEATATFISSGDDASPSPQTTPRVTKLRRIEGRWLIREILTDEEISQMQSSMSSVMDQFGGATEVKSDSEKIPESVKQKSPISAVESSKTEPPEWNEFLKQVPESGTALVMFSYEPEIKEQMLPVARKVAEAASVQLIELPQTTWRKIIAPTATHFVLMKDRQLVGTRTGLMTETRLQDFVGKAKDWLTPQSTGIDESSLVRIDCYINPGRGNAGSQHGGAFPLTTAVVAVHNDQALLLGPDSIAGYIEGGYACVAVVRDEAGKQKQLPLDVLFKGPVKLLGRKTEAPSLEGSVRVKDGDGTVSEVPFASIYPESVTQILEAYDVGTAIYHIRGVHGLTPTKLAAIDVVPQVDQRVLSGGFARERHLPPIHGFSSPILWQSQTIHSVGAIYGNMNGAELFTVNCPRLPAPVGFTFDEHGRLIGRYGLGSPSDKDMTHTVFQTYATHSILHAGMEKIDDPGLKAALAQTLEESKTAASVKDESRQATDDAANANTSQPSTLSPAKFDTPQALLARVDESSKAGSYEEFIALFSEEGVRDLAGSMLMSAVMQTSIDELTQQMSGGLAEVNPDFVAFRKVLQRWLPQSVTTAQQEAMGKGLSTMMSSLGGASPDPAAMKEFVTSMRKSVEGISDHRKFCIEIMQAFEKLTKRKFVFFGNADHENEWQISPFGDRAIATLIDGSPGMATTITLQQANGTWRISSLFNELVIEAQPATTSPTSNASIPSNAKTVTRRYSVGSFVTESFFTDKGNSETQEAYDKHEPELEQSMQDLAKTVTATCSQPPKFVQVLSNSRCLLIGHTEAGHQEIADFMRDIGINNDRIRLRGVTIEITKDEAKSLGIELSHHVVLRSTEDAEKLRTFQKDEKSDSENSSRDGHYRENSSRDFHFVAMEALIQSGTRTHMKTSNGLEQVPIAARIVPGTKEVQIRIDLYGYSDGSEHFHPQFQTLTDGQSVVFALAGDLWWLGTADIVHDANALSEKTDKAASNPQESSTPAAEILQRLQGEWNVKTVTFSAGDPKDLVIRDDLLLLPGNFLGKPIITSMKLEWPNPNMPEEVDIIWEPNDQPNANVIMEPLVGRIRCKGDQLQLCFLDGSRKVTQRPREMCGGTGIFYLECTRKQASVLSKPLKASESDAHSSQGLKYSGQTLSWWLDSYWDNATAIPKTAENAAQEFFASEAIRKLREKPECEAVIETALAKWFASMEHEVNEGQLTRAAKCIVTVAGPAHQETAVQLLFKIWKRMPLLTYAEQGEIADDATELNQLLSQLVLNDQLAAQFAERLTHGDSSDRSLVLYGLLSLMGALVSKPTTIRHNWRTGLVNMQNNLPQQLRQPATTRTKKFA